MKQILKINNFIFFFLIFFAFTFKVSKADDFNYNKYSIEYQKNIYLTKNFENYDYDYDDEDLDYEPQSSKSSYQVWDPWEKMNRKIFDFNLFLVDYVMHPIYYNFYEKITTPGIRKTFHNILSNIKMPLNFANSVLQLDFKNSAKSLYSFGLNTIIGIGGIFDVAGSQGVAPESTNFGITLAKYGVPTGPYLMLPFFGPNDIRGTFAWGVEVFVSPLNENIFKVGGKRMLIGTWFIWVRDTLYVLDNSTYIMENLYDLLKSSFDPYAMTRDAYAQSLTHKLKK